MNTKEYLMRLKRTIEHLHNCSAYYVRTEYIAEARTDKTIWHGGVEVFALVGHQTATRCYGFSCGEREELITILEVPPVTDAQSAVKAGLSYRIEKTRRNRPQKENREGAGSDSLS